MMNNLTGRLLYRRPVKAYKNSKNPVNHCSINFKNPHHANDALFMYLSHEHHYHLIKKFNSDP